MDGVDPLTVLRKAAALQESIAAKEQRKGDKANMSRMADAMGAAAALAIQIAAIEDRRGIRTSSAGDVNHITVELVTPTRPEHIAETIRQRDAAREEVRYLQRQLRANTVATDLPPGPVLIAPPTGNNVVPLVSQANASQSNTLTESDKRQRQARLNHDAALKGAPVVEGGDASQRYADLVGDADNPMGRSRFERFDYPKGGAW